MSEDKVIAVKVFSFPKKKKVRSVSDEELEKFEQQLRQRANDLCAAVANSERLTASDYGIRVTV